MQAVFSHCSRFTGRLPQATIALAATLLAGAAQAQSFDFDSVTRIARERAEKPYRASSDKLPADLAKLNYDQVRDIRWRPDRALWRAEKLPFEAMFFHLGLYQKEPVLINEVTPQGARHIGYSRADFDYGKNQVRPEAWGDLGFAGFRLHNHLNSSAYKDELVVFQGASYFRALGKGQQYGLSARGLAIDTVGGSGEEFPRFTEFWLVRPDPLSTQVTVYALLDSPRATGAYRFDIQPGTQTTTTVRSRIFVRPSTGSKPIATLGIAPLTSMFFFGENQPRPGDFRPEVHDSDGLMIATDDGQGGGEWLWRPLQNPSAPLVTSFSMQKLKGFGLMQRDRNFHSFEDTEARYELRPSAWVTPLSGFGTGRVELLQFATPDETHDNVAAYWVPESMPAAGQPIDLAYQIAWQGKTQQLPPNGWVTQTRRGMGYNKLGADALGQQVQFVVDFAGPALDALPDDAKVEAVTTASANARVVESLAYRNPATGAWRMTLRVERLKTAEPTQANQPIELRAFLQNNQHTLSETWTYLITN